MLLSSNHGHHVSSPFDQMHGFDAGASSSSAASGHYSSSNGRSRGHSSSDNGRPRSASSSESTSTSRSVTQTGRSAAQATSLSDEQRLAALRHQQAQRRPKMLRLTPAVNHLTGATRSLSAAVAPTVTSSSSRQAAESSRPASIIGISSLTEAYASTSSSASASASASADESEPLPNAGLTILTDPKVNGVHGHDDDSKILFPMVGSPPNANPCPLHPGSRKALAQKASLQPANGANLQLDLGCLYGPSISDSSATSANSTSTMPDLVRKKSGEPVKSSLKHFSQSAFLYRSDSSPAAPASFRAKSVPNTPTVLKAVHFDTNLEHVKVFKHRQRPTAVSRDGSPEHTETETEEEKEFPFYQNWRRHAGSLSSPSSASSQGSTASTPTGDAAAEQLVLRLPNFPSSAKLSVDREIFLERVFLSDDLRSVKGTVQVQNLAFEKWVAIRFTLDNWATVCEVSAEYAESIKGGKSDRFTFSIKLNELLIWTRGQEETKTMFLCLRFNAAGQEYWDNNGGENYQLDFRKRPVPLPETPSQPSRVRGESPASMARAATASMPRKAGSPSLGSSEFGSRRTNSRKVFEVEEFSRSLEKLRAQDDADDPRPPIALRSAKSRRSPPASPTATSGRPSSPSLWAARYDFDESLKNPSTGSRKTDAGRQAALDYFSAKPAPPATALQRSVIIRPRSSGSPAMSPTHVEGDVFSPTDSAGSATPGPVAPSTTIVSATGRDGPLAVPIGLFTTKAGMLSPGLGDVIAHIPNAVMGSASATPSPSTGMGSPGSETAITPSLDSPAAISPSPVLAPVMITHAEGRALQNKFYSYPVNRNTLSPVGNLYRSSRQGLVERAPSPLSRSGNELGSGRLSPTKKDRSGGVLLSSSFVSASSPQMSPISPPHSPNPFSPSLSATSLESETTTCLASPEDTVVNSGASSAGSRASAELRAPTSIEDIHRSLFSMARHANGTESTASPGSQNGVEPGSGSPTLSSISDSSSSNGSMKPSSVSSYDELIARFCWHDSSATGSSSGLAAEGSTPTAAYTAGTKASTIDGLPASSQPSPTLNGSGHGATMSGLPFAHSSHRMFANSMGSSTTESGSTTPTIGC